MIAVIYAIFIASLLPVHGQEDFSILLKNHMSLINGSVANEEISKNCSQQLQVYYRGLLSRELWAWQMFDAKTKFPSGLLAGHVFDLGNFDECLDVRHEELAGKYCLGTISTTRESKEGKWTQPRTLGNDPKFSGLHFAVCVPNECTANDVSKIYPLQKFDEKYCYSKETQPKLTWGPITTIVILSILLVIVIVSTSYDIFLHYTGILPGREITIAFSCLTNGKKLLATSKNPNQLLCLDGMKALSMIWIVIFHEYVNGSSGAIVNYTAINEMIQNSENMIIIQGKSAVDTFFVVGGLLTVYTFLKSVEKKVKFNIFLYYLHRYIRLTPVVAVLVLIHATLLKHLGDGPLWNTFDDHLVQPCRKHWWAALLYIQNYVHDEQACVPQTWYLSVDMQLFFLSPLILLPLKKKPKYTIMALILINIFGILVPFFVAYFDEIRAFMVTDKENTQRHIFLYYEQTYGRFGAYTIGMLLGYFVYKIKAGEIKVKLPWPSVAALWVTCLAVLLACIYAGHGLLVGEYDRWAHSLYIAFNRPAWSAAIAGIIFACVTGCGGPVNAFLSAPIFQFLSKISYAIYLVHYAFILVKVASFRTGIWVDHFYFMASFWGDFMFSLGLAVILWLTVESPMITVEKLLLSKAGSGVKGKLDV